MYEDERGFKVERQGKKGLKEWKRKQRDYIWPKEGVYIDPDDGSYPEVMGTHEPHGDCKPDANPAARTAQRDMERTA